MEKNHPIIEQITVEPYRVHTYLVGCEKTKQAVIIDPGGDVERILSLIKKHDFNVRYVLNTHGHADHVLANRALKEALSVPVCMHEADDRFFAAKESGQQSPDPADIRLSDKDTLTVGGLKVDVIHTPGHTPGSVCFLTEGNLFTGDTLFVGAAGRTDLAGGSLDTLITSLEKLIALPPETIIWPGHDYGDTPTSTIGREMKENPYITDFITAE